MWSQGEIQDATSQAATALIRFDKFEQSFCVEQAISCANRLKDTFKILAHKWKYSDHKYKRIYLLCCALYNFLCTEEFHEWPRDRDWFNSNARYNWEKRYAVDKNIDLWEEGVEYVERGERRGEAADADDCEDDEAE